jgi:hypothetical protein
MGSFVAKRMTFSLLVMDCIGHNFHGIWRHPRAQIREFKKLDECPNWGLRHGVASTRQGNPGHRFFIYEFGDPASSVRICPDDLYAGSPEQRPGRLEHRDFGQ